MSGFNVVVLGSLHLDIVVDAPSLPRLGETLACQAFAFKCGGKGGNQAVEAARQGAVTAMVGRVGNDEFGARLLAHLTAQGVDRQAVRTDQAAGTGMSVAIAEPAGDYAALIVSGVNLRLDPSDVDAAVALLRPDGILVLQNEVPAAINVAVALAAHAKGCRILLNAAPARPLDGIDIDFLLVNAIEAEMLGGGVAHDLPSAGAAAQRLAAGGRTTIVTVGGSGLAASGPSGSFTLKPHTVTVASTHGAGDAFAGALAARLAAGDPIDAACGFANAAAAALVATPEQNRAGLSAAAAYALLANS